MVLVFGSEGQLASEFKKMPDCFCFGRDICDFSKMGLASQLILEKKPCAVVNCSAYTNVIGAETDQEKAFQINALTPGDIAKTCDNMNIPLIHVSTDYVYRSSDFGKLTELSVTEPLNVYGHSKLLGEKIITENSARYVIIRTSLLFSERGDNFLIKILNTSRNSQEINVVNDQFAGPTSTSSLASAIVSALNQIKTDPSKAGIYNFCGLPGISRSDFAKAILKEARIEKQVRPISTVDLNENIKRPMRTILDCRKIQNAFGIHAPNWRADMSDTVRFLGKNTAY